MAGEERTFNVGDVVMVYGVRGTVTLIGPLEYVNRGDGDVLRQIIAVRTDKPLSLTTNYAELLNVSGDESLACVPASSVKPYSVEDAAATRIQAFVRMSMCRVKYIQEMAFLFWDHMENLQEQRTLASKRDVYLPILNHLSNMHKTGARASMKTQQRRFSDVFEESDPQKYPESTYDGPKLGKQITSKFANELLDAYKSGQVTNLPIDYAQRILVETLNWYRSNDQGAINHVEVPPYENGNLVVVGDLHGQLNDLLWIFYKFGPPSSRNVYVFNGDIADRGMGATNIFLLLFTFKLADPGSVIINRGNHESEDMNETYGFAKEVRMKYDGHIYKLFQRIFWELPLVVIIEKRIIIVHGGLFRHDGVTLDLISKVNRKRMCPASPDSFEDSIVFDLLWSDPQNKNGRDVSTRGADCIRFGPDVTAAFLDLNKLEVCIRSHQVPSTLKGIDTAHNGRCVTLFSASNYCQTTGNTGAILIFSKGLHFEVKEYMSPALESIRALANNTNMVTNKVLDAALSLQMEKATRFPKRRSSEKMLDDILIKIAAVVCENKQALWLHCYKYDTTKSGMVEPLPWTEGLSEIVGIKIPRIFSIWLLKAMDKDVGKVPYNDVLKRFQIGFDPVGQSHKNLQRECIAHIFDTMIKSDLSLKEILMVFDRNLDGVVSYAELDEAIRKLNVGLSHPQIKILMRTILSSCVDKGGKADIVEFLSKLKVIYSASTRYNIKEEWMEAALPAIGKVILSDRTEAAARYYNPNYNSNAALAKITEEETARRRSSAIRAVALFQKFQDYDRVGGGLLSYSDFAEAIKKLDLSKAEQELGFEITDRHLFEIAHMIDSTNTNKINYLEFLQAFYVVDQNKYSVVNEMWDHVCSTLYKHRSSLRQAFHAYDTTHEGSVYIHEFKEVLHALYDTLGYNEAPFTFEQTEILVECIDTNDDGMIMYNDFLESFHPQYTMTV
ncbi:Serine/threonine-protein phosphatase 5 [Babesia sp. Xinjiang]|uniref:Serine/threonine-protein phosphatase 5 n=1 Tax=Babesia sp. Xinjiang TaxID=462227 RepID=UPI000A2641E6|nr:Serine/threonine-protein phosphatase 5 [Babesia sp. Xinjiang]ORM39625.1 Serine/threonine-protein phosphatase 5 [Babesia sp. Xinjiang]